MSTRSQVDFHNKKPSLTREPEARIYHHWDGYPSSRLVDIDKAVKAAIAAYTAEKMMKYRIRDIHMYMTDVAAFYVLENKPHERDFGEGPTVEKAGDVEIDNTLHADIDFLYQVWGGDHGTIQVRILAPRGAEYALAKEPSLELMEVVAEGSLEDLLAMADRQELP